jgi:hypothetical protein
LTFEARFRRRTVSRFRGASGRHLAETGFRLRGPLAKEARRARGTEETKLMHRTTHTVRTLTLATLAAAALALASPALAAPPKAGPAPFWRWLAGLVGLQFVAGEAGHIWDPGGLRAAPEEAGNIIDPGGLRAAPEEEGWIQDPSGLRVGDPEEAGILLDSNG